MAITRKTVKDTSTLNTYDATSDVYNLVKSGAGGVGDRIWVDSTSDNFSVRFIGNTLVMKGEDGQIIKINITKPAVGVPLTDTISFLDGDVHFTITNTAGKTAASLVTLDTVPKTLKLTTKYVAFALDLTDSSANGAGVPGGSGDHFTGGVTVVVGSDQTLTNGTDVLTGNIFDSGLVYTPGGNDRINSLQSEDVLIADTATNPTLNVTLGQSNDNSATTVTPTLTGINTVNASFTGDTNIIDLRYADSLTTLAIQKITQEAHGSGTFQNISQKVANLSVSNVIGQNGGNGGSYSEAEFAYKIGVLAGSADSGKIAVTGSELDSLGIGATNAINTANEGFESLELTASGTNIINTLAAYDLENLTIKGSAGALTIGPVATGVENTTYGTGGIDIGDGIGIRSIDASAFTGTLSIDIGAAVSGHIDPANSGAWFYTNIKGGTGSDLFWTHEEITGKSTALHDIIDGTGTGNTLLTYANIKQDSYSDTATDDIAEIKNIQTLRVLKDNTIIDLNAFDANLATVIVRDEDTTGTNEFTLKNVGTAMATGGQIYINHPISGGGDTTLKLFTKDASGTTDTVAISVQNDRNKDFEFNYVLNIDGNEDLATQKLIDAQKIENVTVNDLDTETNTVVFTKATEHTGTVTLTGGSTGTDYTVESSLIATTVDAHTDLSNLRLNVGKADQTISLGHGDDILTFSKINSLNASDIVTDNGGTDTVRAAFSADVSGQIHFTGIENFHVVAISNTTIDMTSAGTISEFAVLSDKATNGDTDKSPKTQEPFNLIGVDTTDTITLTNTSLSSINFFGDNDTDDVKNHQTQAQVFNGVKLSSNSSSIKTVDININSSLDAEDGALSYSLGALEVQGFTSTGNTINITVGDENVDYCLTTITSLDSDLAQNINVSAVWDVDLGIITGNATNNSLVAFDSTAVGGHVTAEIRSLKTAATVSLGDGGNTIDASASAGLTAFFTSGTGEDYIIGTAHDDDIQTSSGNDTILGGNGNDNINAGDGNDMIQQLGTGSNTIAFSSGHSEFAAINRNTGVDIITGGSWINTFTLGEGGKGTAGMIFVDRTGDDFTADDFLAWVAVGDGADVNLKWDKLGFTSSNAVITGGTTYYNNAGAAAGTNNVDMIIDSAGASPTIAGQAGNDVLLGWNFGTNYSINGGSGNDGIVAMGGNDTVTGGTGADFIVIEDTGIYSGSASPARDIVVFSDGDSTATSIDKVIGFDNGSYTGATFTQVDVLDLPSNVVAGNSTNNYVNETLHLDFVDGIISFTDDVLGSMQVSSKVDPDNLHLISLSDAISYASSILTNGPVNGATAAFQYDYSGDLVSDEMILVQDATTGTNNTVVELVGVSNYGSSFGTANGLESLATITTAASLAGYIYIA